MEITENKINELNKSNDVLAKCTMVKEIFLRASTNPELKNYFSDDIINSLFSMIKVCKTEEIFKENYLKGLDQKDRENVNYFDIPMAFSTVKDNKVYIKENTNIDVIVHELIHVISNQKSKGSGILEVAKEYYFNNIDQDKLLEIDSLNEAITHFITQFLIPEVKISDGYNYGSEIINKYYNVCKDESNKPQRIFDCYFNGNSEAFGSIIADFGNHWNEIMNSINKTRFKYLYRTISNDTLTEQNIDQILQEIRNKFEINNNKNLEEYYVVRGIYSKEEQNKLLEISEQKNSTVKEGKKI